VICVAPSNSRQAKKGRNKRELVAGVTALERVYARGQAGILA
jgi:hypothetical protein